MRTVQQFLYGNGTRLVESGNSTRPAVPLSCPASNCTWPEYETLAMCSQCVQLDTSGLLTYACMNTTIDWSVHSTTTNRSLPFGEVCGYFVNATSDKPILMSGYIVANSTSKPGEALLVRALPLTELYTKKSFYGVGSIHFRDLRNTLLDALFVSASNGSESVYSHQKPIVHECALSWCVKSIKSSYTWGHYQEEVIAVHRNTTPGPWPWDSFEVPQDEGGGWFVTYLENITIEAPVSSWAHTNSTALTQSFGATNLTTANAQAIFDDFFPSYYTTDDVSAKPALRYKNFLDGPSIRALEFNPWLAPNNITSHMARLATAVTNDMRSDIESITMVPGLAYNKKQYIVVHWEWLIFPLTLLVLSFGFLLATVLKTSRNAHGELDVWKTSAMPALIYSLPKDVQREVRSVKSAEVTMRRVKVRLSPEEGWRVSTSQDHSFLSSERRLNHQPPPGWI